VSELVPLASGAEMRITNGGCERMVVCLNGGRAREVPGTWSTSLFWLVDRLAPGFAAIGFAEVCYRIKSWRRLELCIEDARAAIDTAAGRKTLLLGFSMGGAVAISAAGEAGVVGVVGLAPWIPDRLDLSVLRGRRLDVAHGSLDRSLPGVPGVSSAVSRRGFERARALGVEGSYTIIAGGVHGIALRAPGGAVLRLPRAAAWARFVEAQLGRFAA
jgi:pimeloyl-ACP methyl ester carboxylesterase